MNARYYAVDPENAAVSETDAVTGKPVELMVDLDAGLSRTQVVGALVSITDYIARNQPAAAVESAIVEAEAAPPPPEPPPTRPSPPPKAPIKKEPKSPWHHRSRRKARS